MSLWIFRDESVCKWSCDCYITRPCFAGHLTLSLTHSHTQPTHPLTHTLTHSLIYSLTHSLTNSHTHPFTHSPTHTLTHSLTRSSLSLDPTPLQSVLVQMNSWASLSIISTWGASVVTSFRSTQVWSMTLFPTSNMWEQGKLYIFSEYIKRVSKWCSVLFVCFDNNYPVLCNMQEFLCSCELLSCVMLSLNFEL